MASAYNAPAWAATSATDDGVVLAACCASPSIFGAGSVPVVVIDHPPRPSGEPESVRSLRGRPSAPRRECTAGRSNEDEVTQSLHHERIEGERLRRTRTSGQSAGRVDRPDEHERACDLERYGSGAAIQPNHRIEETP